MMKKKVTMSWLTIVGLGVSTLLLTSCGTNVFESLVEKPHDIDPISILEEAQSVEDYEQAEAYAMEVLTSEDASKQEVIDSLITVSETELGKNSISPFEISQKFAESASSGSTDGRSMINEFESILSPDDPESGNQSLSNDLMIAALAANKANDLSLNDFFGTSLRSNVVAQLDENEQMTRMITNALASVAIVLDVFEVTIDGQIEPTVLFSQASFEDMLTALIRPNLSEEVQAFLDTIDTEGTFQDQPIGFPYFANETINAAKEANIFTEEQETIIETIQTYGNKFLALFNAVTEQQTFVEGGITYDFSGILSPEEKSEKIEQALTQMFSTFTI